MPEAPGGWPLVGHTWTLYWNTPWDLFEKWAAETGKGIARCRVFNKHMIIIATPELCKQVLASNLANYAKDVGFSYKPFLSILGTGLVTSEGDLWKKQRLLVSKAFRVEILDHIIDIATRAVDRFSDKWEAYRGKGLPVELSEEFRHLTLQVIGEAILSMPPEECDRVFPRLYLPVMEESNRRVLAPWRTFLPNAAWFAYRRQVSQLNSYIIGILCERWEARQRGEGRGAPPDIVDRVMDAIPAGDWGPAAQRQLCYEIKTFLLAGHETSAAMLTFALYELTQHPDVLARVRKEAEAVFGKLKKGEVPAREACESMDMTYAVLKETLRLYSVVPVVTRLAVGSDTLAGYDVPAGATIIISLQGVHQNPQVWKDPTEFRPQRFMDPPETDDAYAFIPFIQGPRNCLGQHLALLEARVVLGLLARRFTFTPVRGAAANKKDPKMIPIGPADGLEMTLE